MGSEMCIRDSCIGIRPEHVDVSATEGSIQGTINVSEHLGSDTFFHVNCEALNTTLTVRVDGEVGFNRGDKVFLTPKSDLIHRFDEQGLRL